MWREWIFWSAQQGFWGMRLTLFNSNPSKKVFLQVALPVGKITGMLIWRRKKCWFDCFWLFYKCWSIIWRFLQLHFQMCRRNLCILMPLEWKWVHATLPSNIFIRGNCNLLGVNKSNDGYLLSWAVAWCWEMYSCLYSLVYPQQAVGWQGKTLFVPFCKAFYNFPVSSLISALMIMNFRFSSFLNDTGSVPDTYGEPYGTVIELLPYSAREPGSLWSELKGLSHCTS